MMYSNTVLREDVFRNYHFTTNSNITSFLSLDDKHINSRESKCLHKHAYSIVVEHTT